MSDVLIINYHMGNLGSVRRAFEECGAHRVLVTDNPSEAGEYTHLVLPGVGAFGKGMERLSSLGWVTFIRESVQERNIPLLGICLGMQLLSERGYEGGVTTGLELIPGEVKRMKAQESERIPHIGWNEVHHDEHNALLESIPTKTDFYFVHSFGFLVPEPRHVIGVTPYAGGFNAVVNRGLVYGVQFHPEKSQKPGFQLLRNFLKMERGQAHA